MIKGIFCIYDKVCELFRTPMFAPNVAVMVRDLGDEVRRGGDGNSLFAHPRDYCLHEMGSFEEETGKFTLYESSKFVVEVSALVDPVVDPAGHVHGDQVVPDVGHSHSSGSVATKSVATPARVVLNPQVGMP